MYDIYIYIYHTYINIYIYIQRDFPWLCWLKFTQKGSIMGFFKVRPQLYDSEVNAKKNFTSCYPHEDIYTFCYWQIFWRSI